MAVNNVVCGSRAHCVPFTGQAVDRSQVSQDKSVRSHFICLSFPISCFPSLPLIVFLLPHVIAHSVCSSFLYSPSLPLSYFGPRCINYSHVHRLFDWRAINKIYQGHHVTPEHPPVTHTDCRHAHTRMEKKVLESRLSSHG